MTGRTAMKALIESLLVSLGPATLSRRAFRRRALVLAYHNIVPAGEFPGADRSLHLPEALFRAQLDHLEAYAEIVPLETILQEAPGVPARPRVAITFDDAYRGAVTTGLPELARRGHPATMFVAPGRLGGEGFWWDRVAEASGDPAPEAFRREALEIARGQDPKVLDLARARGLLVVEPPAHAQPATEMELAAAASVPGLSLAAHSWSHPNLSQLTSTELEPELSRPVTWLEERFPRAERWLAYPYGLSSPAVEAAALAAGYAAAFRVDGGWLPAADRQPARLPRLNVPAGLSLRGFVLRTAGLLAA